MKQPPDDTSTRRAPRQFKLAIHADFDNRFARRVAALSWWRIVAIFLVVLIAASVISDTLGLEHGHASKAVVVRGKKAAQTDSPDKGESVVITIGGKEVVRIEEDPARKGDAAEAGASVKPGDAPSHWTFRGILGDLGKVLVTLFLAYLVAAKIIVRKVDESEAKVKTAVDMATREAVERQLVEARLQVMQAQVEPHFLFNTLGAVDYLIETDPARATQMQKALIRYLRGALPQMRETRSSLGRELRLVQAYLEVMKMRIEDRLHVAYEVPDGLSTAEFPPMMLQSLVENAIKHGIEPKPEGGTVTVAAGIKDGLLWVEVRDTGVGLPGDDVLDRPTRGSGIGLRNIRERLAMIYPGASRLTLRSDEHAGTAVRISVPYRVTEVADDGEGAARAGEA